MWLAGGDYKPHLANAHHDHTVSHECSSRWTRSSFTSWTERRSSFISTSEARVIFQPDGTGTTTNGNNSTKGLDEHLGSFRADIVNVSCLATEANDSARIYFRRTMPTLYI